LCNRATDHLIFQTFDWAWRGWTCVASVRGRQLNVVVGRLGARVVLIWPLTTRRFLGLSIASALDSETTEYREIVVEDGPGREDWVSQAWDFVTRQRGVDALYLQYLPEDGLLDTAAHLHRGVASGREGRRYLDCRSFPDWANYFQSLSSNRRSDIRRRRRRLEERAAVKTVRITEGEQLEEFLSWFFETKYSALSDVAGTTNWFTAPEHREFLTSILHDGLRSGVTVATAIMADGNYIAGKVYADYRQTRNLLVTTYDRDWALFAPGVLLYEEAVRGAFDGGFHTIDFRLGDEPFKTAWINRTGTVCDYWIPCTPLDKMYVNWRKSALRRLLKRGLDFLR